jgi:hypothetical protein
MEGKLATFDHALGEDIEKVWSDKFIQKTFEAKMAEWQVRFYYILSTFSRIVRFLKTQISSLKTLRDLETKTTSRIAKM